MPVETIAQRIVRRAADSGASALGAAVAPIEPMAIVHPVVDDFGTGLFGDHSPNDVQDSINLFDARMAALGQSYARLAPAWSQRDLAGMSLWTADWNGLQQRYAAARASAQSATIPIIGAFSANSAYDALLKAVKQCAPPDGCPPSRGDLDDLVMRLVAAGGQNVSPSRLPTPTSTDLDMAMYTNPAFQAAANAGQGAAGVIDDLARTAAGAAGAAKEGLDFVAWLSSHKTLLLVVGGSVLGLMVLGMVMPYMAIAAKGARAVGAGAKGVAALAA
jgi:hypothetical protein